MKPKSTTLIEKMGFSDPDLKSVAHDRIMLWLLKDDNAIQIIGKLVNLRELFTIQLTCSDWIYDYIHNNCELIKDICPINLNDKSWREKIEFCPKHEQIMYEYGKYLLENLEYNILPEYAVTRIDNNYIIGFVDLRVRLRSIELDPISIVKRNNASDFYFEVKTRVESFGETLRQIQTYRKYLPPEAVFILVTPKTPYREAFEGSGVLVHEIPDELLTEEKEDRLEKW